MWPVFIGWINVFKTSPRLSRDVFRTLKTDCKICVFICPDKLLQGKKFPWKNVKFDFFSENGGGGGIFWIFRKKTDFWRKIVRRVIRTVLKVSRGTFWGERCFSENFSNKEMFSNIQQNFNFCRFLACLCKNRPCVQMNLLRKFFFEQIFV